MKRRPNSKAMAADVALAVSELREAFIERLQPLVSEDRTTYWMFAKCGLTKDEFSKVANLLEAGSIREALGLVALRAYEFGVKHRPSVLAKGKPDDPNWMKVLQYMDWNKVQKKDVLAQLCQRVKSGDKLSFIFGGETITMRPMPRHRALEALKLWTHRKRARRRARG